MGVSADGDRCSDLNIVGFVDENLFDLSEWGVTLSQMSLTSLSGMTLSCSSVSR